MANRHITAVARADLSSVLSPRMVHPVKSVLKVFADHANDSNTSWPHMDTIALEAGLKAQSVSRATTAAVEAGLLLKRRTLLGNHYRLNMSLIGQLYVPPKQRFDPDFDTPQQSRTQPSSSYAKRDTASREEGYHETRKGRSRNATQNPQGAHKEPPTNQPSFESPAADAGADDSDEVDGWMGEEPKNKEKTESPTAGEQLLASVERRNTATLTAQRDQHVATVDAALKVLPRDQVMAVLSDGLDTASQPAGALVARIRHLPEKVRQHQADRQRLAERDRKLTERDAEPQQATSTVPAPAAPTSSPVDWLTDEQYDALSLQDQAKVRASASAELEDLTEKASRDLAAIHRKVMDMEPAA